MANGVPLEVKEISYLDFASGNEVLGKYNEAIAKYGDKARLTLAKLSLGDNGLIRGSNPFMNVQLGSLVNLAMPVELEKAFRQNPDFFGRTYEDIALILRSEEDSYAPNDFVAKHLAEQVKRRIGNAPTPENPARISLKGLSLQEDENSEYGLVFNIGEGAEVISVPEFSHTNFGKRFARTDERGVPIFDAQGSRKIYTKSQGLSRLFLDRSSNLGSSYGSLAGSGEVGRVALVRNVAVSQKNLGYSPELINQALASVMAKKGISINGLESEVSAELKRLDGEI